MEGEELADSRETTSFPGIELILRIDRDVSAAGAAVRHETRYFVGSCSADQVSAAQLLDRARGPWCIEHGLHFIKDRWWDEDRQWSTRSGLAERLAMRRDAAVTALRVLPDVPKDRPIRARADHLGRRLQKGLKFIGALK